MQRLQEWWRPVRPKHEEDKRVACGAKTAKENASQQDRYKTFICILSELGYLLVSRIPNEEVLGTNAMKTPVKNMQRARNKSL